MNPKIILIVLAILALFGVGYKLVAPTSKTVIEKGGRQVIVNTDKPQVPLGGCSIYKLNMKSYWENGFKTK